MITAKPKPVDMMPDIKGHRLATPKTKTARRSASTNAPVLPSGRCQNDLDNLCSTIKLYLHFLFCLNKYSTALDSKIINFLINRTIYPASSVKSPTDPGNIRCQLQMRYPHMLRSLKRDFLYYSH